MKYISLWYNMAYQSEYIDNQSYESPSFTKIKISYSIVARFSIR